MIDRTVLAAEPRKFRIGLQFIGRNCRALAHVLDNVRFQRHTPDVLDIPCHHITLAFQHSEHIGFSGSAATTLAARTATADHRFIGLDVSRS